MDGTDIAAGTPAATGAEGAAAQLAGFLRGLLSTQALVTALKAAAILVIGLALVRLASKLAGRLARGRFEGRGGELVARSVRYLGFVVVAVNLFDVLGVDLSALLGAAGIAGIAIGFAAQTSMSNLISGIFLLSEKSFAPGDVIQVDATSGVVETVDLLSVKLRTFDNRLVRIPNETLVKSNLVNATRYPIRRLDIPVGVAYGTDLDAARRILMELAEASPVVLAEPAPLFLVDAFAPSAINLLFGPWIRKEDYLAAKNELIPAIARRFRAEGVPIAFQTVTLDPNPFAAPSGTDRKAAADRARAPRKPARKRPET